MSKSLCRLCASYPSIENSHIIPGFVYRAIKSDSPTGFFRNPNNPKQRVQDGDKLPILCAHCEQRFSDAEGKFATNVFSAFHANDQDHFAYGSWLHYFVTSLAWRTLILDLPGLEADPANPRATVGELVEWAETMRLYLLGANNLGGRLRNHVVVWTAGHSGSTRLAAAGPNVRIRRSVFGYSILDRVHGYSGILHNLAGFMCFLIVKENPRDRWNGTKVKPTGGEIKQPQQASSWLMEELLSCIDEIGQKKGLMSEAQREKVVDAMSNSPTARGLRFRELDTGFVVDD